MRLLATILLCTVFICSCSVKRYLPPGEKLYRGATIKVEKHPETKESEKSLKKLLKLAAKPAPNKYFLGQPYKVWFWYIIGEPKREKGFRAFLRKKLAEEPVLSSRVNAKGTPNNMQVFMSNIGYFHTTAQGDTIHQGYFSKAIYTIQVQPRYTLNKIEWRGDTIPVMKLLSRNAQRRGLLKPGNPYQLSDITAERDRLDLFLKRRGYYFFNPDYIMAYADSTIGNRKVDLYLNLKNDVPATAKQPYKISRISVFADYNLADGNPDTTMTRMQYFDSLHIRDDHKKFTPKLFATTITYRPGSLYNSNTQNATLNRFISLGTFKFVKNRFEALPDSSNPRLNVYYYLTPAQKKSLQGGIDAFTKENNFMGAQVNVNWRNRNAFKGAEQLGVKVYGAFETSFADSLKGNNNYRLGTELTLKIPRYFTPFIRIKENNFYPPKTNILLGYEWFRKQLSYTKNIFRLQYEFTWKTNVQNEFTLAPVSLSYINASNISDAFKQEVIADPSLGVTVFSEAVLGSFLSYTYNSGAKSRKNKLYLNTSLDLSGNLAGLITGAKRFREKEIFNTAFAQFVKFDINAHYSRKGSNRIEWANRLQLGIGIPYNNSRALPFNKLYTVGGSSSIRGYRARNLGPGTNKPSAEQQRYFQIIGGDIKLLANTELRIPVTNRIGTALFVDAGNVWTKDTILFGPSGKFTSNFYKEIAVATGIGIRFDLTVLMIRADLAIPVRKPFNPSGNRWVFDEINFGNSNWRRENLILNIAIGYPF